MIQECYKRRAADALAYDDMQTENQLAKVKLVIKVIRKQHKHSGNFLTHPFGRWKYLCAFAIARVLSSIAPSMQNLFFQ